MSRAERLLDLVQTLRRYRQPVSGHTLAGELGVSKFALDSGLMLGLWSRQTVEPAATAGGGGAELAFTVPDLEAAYVEGSGRGVSILREPADMDLGRTFVALDPDGHRLRVFAPV
jgi:predicted enzyme related to lactoylglutathione lyase